MPIFPPCFPPNHTHTHIHTLPSGQKTLVNAVLQLDGLQRVDQLPRIAARQGQESAHDRPQPLLKPHERRADLSTGSFTLALALLLLCSACGRWTGCSAW